MSPSPDKFLHILRIGLAAAFFWGALVAIASKIEIRHAVPATPWVIEREP